MEKRTGSRNGKIELYRFLFAILVILFHYEKYMIGEPSLDNGIHFALCPHGAMGVEFFFLLSGFFMAKSLDRLREQQSPEERARVNPSDGLRFMWGKYTAVFPQHVIAFFLCFVTYIWYKGYTGATIILKLVDSIPNFFLVQMSGINFTNPNHVEWYLSCMLLAMFLLYPVCKKYYQMVYKYIAPILSLIVVGYCIKATGGLTGVSTWMGITYKSMLRAIVELLLGGSAYELSKWINLRCVQDFATSRLFLTSLELCSLFVVILYIITTAPKAYEAYVLFLLFILVSVAGSDASYSLRFFNTKLCLFLGKLSLPLYLSQVAVIWIGMKLEWHGMEPFWKFFVLLVILTLVVYFGGSGLGKIGSHMFPVSKTIKESVHRNE